MDVIVVIFAVLIYFLPALIALSRHHGNATAIFFLNLFLGWTLLGWVAALVWGLTKPSSVYQIQVESQKRIRCPHCAELILPAAKICPHCKTGLSTA